MRQNNSNISQVNSIYIVDDDRDVADSIGFFLSVSGYFPKVYRSGRDFLKDVPSLHPGCVLLDIRMPDLDGLQVVGLLGPYTAKFPVIIMTGHGDVQTAVAAMKLGVRDFIEKPFEEVILLQILDRAQGGLGEQLRLLDEQSTARDLIERLTPRETDVLRGLVEGLSNKMLAFKLNVSTRTVEMHRANMMERLGANSLSDALKIAFAAGLTGLS